ncbi:hypothetical protein Ahu01nite_020370 [Winogradskya humida]|uniref:Uncharacterized protein n=1 Tax=Winogradskya humida TaxID=113566 RepID=A0ABQ3ZK17_9ACTN|nr:hypothetical protein Ahu01nite_020370 [Actinoplanes humidus]
MQQKHRRTLRMPGHRELQDTSVSSLDLTAAGSILKHASASCAHGGIRAQPYFITGPRSVVPPRAALILTPPVFLLGEIHPPPRP